MKRILCSSFLLVLLAACSSVPLEEASTSPAGATGSAPNIALQPLVVPAASAFRTTRARPLSGKFQKASWADLRSEEHQSELQSLMRISYAVFCLKKKNEHHNNTQ